MIPTPPNRNSSVPEPTAHNRGHVASVGGVNFTLRQWAVIAGLSAAFIVAAVLVSSSGGGDSTWDEAPAFDEVAWCEAANAISRWSSVLDGSATGDSLTDVQNLRQALSAARPVAPQDLTFEIARLQDLTLLVEQATEREGDLATGLAEAQQNVDRERVAQAVETVGAALVDCGHPPIGG